MIRHFALAALVAASSLSLSARDIVSPRSHKDFLDRKAQLADAPEGARLKALDDPSLTGDRRDALEFLYTYMQLPDLVDRDSAFYLDCIDASLLAAKEMPWGSKVPDREWKHFVLPPRINNEALDSSRTVFYAELRDRVKDLSMKDAILEVNHWCHEKVTYRPSDGRTSNPLSAVSQAIGRCGEESTFTVAALRAVGIPARQVYTPRWAHTDDNHAWVEAWADGKWYFLGACEPEPVLNLGWFNAPASRGMMMNTKVFGNYDGPEEVLEVSPCYTAINVTSNYAPVSSIRARVLDSAGHPVEDANVRFSLYNYAEYYPLAVKSTDADGFADLSTGIGDLVVWASDKSGRYGLSHATVGRDSVVDVTLAYGPGPLPAPVVLEWTLVPPVGSGELPFVSEEMRLANELRKVAEDSIRGAYTDTFLNPESAAAWCAANGYDASVLAPLLVESRGNHAMLTDWLGNMPDSLRGRAVRLLANISEKDRRDIPRLVLDDFIVTPDGASSFHDSYVLSPRVLTEQLTPWRSFFNSVVPAADRARFAADPDQLAAAIASGVAPDNVWNPQGLLMSPEQAYTIRRADNRSRSLLFVAMARSFGVPARVDAVSGNTQWADADGTWHNVTLEAEVPQAAPAATATLNLTYDPAGGHVEDPAYFAHFSLSEIADGTPRLMEYDEFAPWSKLFSKPEPIAPGSYILTSGQRLASGAVLARTVLFSVADGQTVDIPLVMRRDTTEVEVIGSFNAEDLYHDRATDTDKSLLSTSGRGYYVLGVVAPGHEPSEHALRDIALKAADLEKWGRTIFILEREGVAAGKDLKSIYGLPDNVVLGTDIDGTIAAELEATDLPVFIIADTFNRVVYRTDGYMVNLGDRLVDTLSKLK